MIFIKIVFKKPGKSAQCWAKQASGNASFLESYQENMKDTWKLPELSRNFRAHQRISKKSPKYDQHRNRFCIDGVPITNIQFLRFIEMFYCFYDFLNKIDFENFVQRSLKRYILSSYSNDRTRDLEKHSDFRRNQHDSGQLENHRSAL